MSLQALTANFLIHQGIATGGYYYSPSLNSKLDQITEQIIKTQDSALEFIKLIENGAARKSWESQKTRPSVTWLGNMVDKIFGWGKYHGETQKTLKFATEAGQKRHIMWSACPNIEDEVIRDYLQTSFEVQIYPNQSCAQLDWVNYWTEIFQFIEKPVTADDLICRVAGCVQKRLLACYPTCLPCHNATDAEKNDTLDTSSDFHFFQSDIDQNLMWAYLIETKYQTNRSMLNAWKLKQIQVLFNTTIKECQNQILHSNQDTNNAYYAFLIVPVIISGGVIFWACKRKKTTEAWTPLEAIQSL